MFAAFAYLDTQNQASSDLPGMTRAAGGTPRPAWSSDGWLSSWRSGGRDGGAPGDGRSHIPCIVYVSVDHSAHLPVLAHLACPVTAATVGAAGPSRTRRRARPFQSTRGPHRGQPIRPAKGTARESAFRAPHSKPAWSSALVRGKLGPASCVHYRAPAARRRGREGGSACAPPFSTSSSSPRWPPPA